MKILQIQGDPDPQPSRPVSAAPTPAPVPLPVPAPDLGRVDALETIAQSILKRIHAIEERIDALETSSSPAASSGGPISSNQPPTETLGGDGLVKIPVAIDTETFKKALFTKMWKYLNNKAAA